MLLDSAGLTFQGLDLTVVVRRTPAKMRCLSVLQLVFVLAVSDPSDYLMGLFVVVMVKRQAVSNMLVLDVQEMQVDLQSSPI